MKKEFFFVSLCLLILTGLLVLSGKGLRNRPVTSRDIEDANTRLVVADYGELPLSFEPNLGQTDAPVKFLSRGSGYTLFLTPSEAVLALRGGQVKLSAAGQPRPAKWRRLETRRQP